MKNKNKTIILIIGTFFTFLALLYLLFKNCKFLVIIYHQDRDLGIGTTKRIQNVFENRKRIETSLSNITCQPLNFQKLQNQLLLYFEILCLTKEVI